ncbi:long-chain fatty acid--CoA ligase [Aeromicrobium panaciterrae]|uniref:long-chain fatty acid--CoA ligase n=1 Tax=Aeromicrobium panaciterrae TaxID=363861 RepID=UPI0031CE1411
MTGQILNGNSMDDYPLTLTSIVDRAERFHANRGVISRRPSGDVNRTTYGEVAGRARRLAHGLAALGVRDGDPVATMLWNQSEHLELYFAVPAMGAVLHTLNPRLFPEELSYIVNDAQDNVIIVDESLLPVFETIRDSREFAHVVVVSHTGDIPAGMLDYESLVANNEPIEWPVLGEGRAAAMCYTSGTTGRPKGVVYSHRALVLHSLVVALPDQFAVSARDTILPVVPMFHANAWGLPYAAALAGAQLVLPGPQLDSESVLDLLAAEHVTMTAGVPTVWMGVLSSLDAEPDRWDLSALNRLIVGGAAVPRSMLEGFDRHELSIVQAWGMTETAPLGSVCRVPEDLDQASNSDRYNYRIRQGVASPLVDIRARDDEGNLIAWDDTAMGELEVRGPWVAASYHHGQGAASFTADGWFSTGDVVRIDPRGCIRICDRSKDLVKSGGEWISSVDLENQLVAHPDVAQAAVIAVPDDRWGERPLAVVSLHPDVDPSVDKLRDHLAQDFAKWQLPDRFEFVSEIPSTATGKVKKSELRKRFTTEP